MIVPQSRVIIRKRREVVGGEGVEAWCFARATLAEKEKDREDQRFEKLIE